MDEKNTGLPKLHAAAVREAGVTAVGFENIVFGVGQPMENFDFGLMCPTERPGHKALIAAVYAAGIVRAGAAKPGAQFWIAGISVGAGVDQYFLFARTHNDAQGVGMA